jgi:hypothetical protein
VQHIPIKGNYTVKNEFISQKPYDEVWSNIIDIFAKNGIPIGVLDKTSGIITSPEQSFPNNYTYELDNGSLENPTAWIVLERIVGPDGRQVTPQKVTAIWNVRIKQINTGVSVNINLLNINGSLVSTSRYGTISETWNGKSTGVFESIIFKQINNPEK